MAAKPVSRAVLGDLTNVARIKTSAINKRSIKSRILNVTKNRGITKRTSGGRVVRVASKSSQGVTSTTSLEEQHISRLEEEQRFREEQCRQRLEDPQVEDIDARDRENPQVCSEYAAQIYSHLRQLEGRYQLPRDPLAGLPVTGRMRAVLADWLVEVQQQFKLQQETLFLTLSIVDRYLACEGRFLFKSQLQLLGVSAMFIAAKIEEIFAPEVNDFVYVTDDAYTKEEVKHMELKILAALNWDFSAPLGINFLRRYSRAGDVSPLQHNLAKFSLELGLQEYQLLGVPASQQAAASLHLSLLLLAPGPKVWSPTLQHYSGYTAAQLEPTVSLLAAMMSRAPTTKLQAVRTKYRDSKFHRVSLLPQLERCSQLVSLLPQTG